MQLLNKEAGIEPQKNGNRPPIPPMVAERFCDLECFLAVLSDQAVVFVDIT